MLAKEDKYAQMAIVPLTVCHCGCCSARSLFKSGPTHSGNYYTTATSTLWIMEIHLQPISLPISGIMDQLKFLSMTFNIPTQDI